MSGIKANQVGEPQQLSPRHKETQQEFDKRIINRAVILSGYALAEPAQCRPFGAIVVRDADRKLISESVSDTGDAHDPTAHGELLAIRAACNLLGKDTLSDCTIYSSCEPCPMCSALIGQTKLSRLVYACAWKQIDDVIDMSHLFEYVSKPTLERSTPAVQIDEPKAEGIIRSWYQDQEEETSD